MKTNEELQEIAEDIVNRRYRQAQWLVQALRKHVKRGLVPQPWYLANCETIRTMFREGMGIRNGRYVRNGGLHLYDRQLVCKYMADIIIDQL